MARPLPCRLDASTPRSRAQHHPRQLGGAIIAEPWISYHIVAGPTPPLPGPAAEPPVRAIGPGAFFLTIHLTAMTPRSPRIRGSDLSTGECESVLVGRSEASSGCPRELFRSWRSWRLGGSMPFRFSRDGLQHPG